MSPRGLHAPDAVRLDNSGFSASGPGAVGFGTTGFDKAGPDQGTGLKAVGRGAERISGDRSIEGSNGEGAAQPSRHVSPRHGSGAGGNVAAHREAGGAGYARGADEPVYGALDLGTNNCRLLLARPSRRGFRVIDAFSRIIRLGEGVSQSGELSEAAMVRTIEALKICAGKMDRHQVRRAMLVATEACRIARNGGEFLSRAREATGLDIQILSREGEARLAVSGCASLVDPDGDFALVFDIGGGSSELVWLDLSRRRQRGSFADRLDVQSAVAAWTSLSVGVVTLAERFGGRNVTRDSFEAMVGYVVALLAPFEAQHQFAGRIAGSRVHLLGTSGTVTTVAGVHLGLERYDRNRVDGCWLETEEARRVTYSLLDRNYAQRVAEPCIGRDRADLVLAGCAILEALLRVWPAPRLRVADRGLREGILMQLMVEDGVYRAGRRRRRLRGRPDFG